MPQYTTSITDEEWGTIVNIDLVDVEPGEVVRYLHIPSGEDEYAIVVASSQPADIGIIAGGEQDPNSYPLDPLQVDLEGEHDVRVVEEHRGAVEVQVFVSEGQRFLSLGFLKRGWRRATRSMRSAVERFVNECTACKALVRFALNVATGGGDVAADLVDRALEQAAEAMQDILGDTILSAILEKILDVVSGAFNPGKLVASAVCEELGHCP